MLAHTLGRVPRASCTTHTHTHALGCSSFTIFPFVFWLEKCLSHTHGFTRSLPSLLLIQTVPEINPLDSKAHLQTGAEYKGTILGRKMDQFILLTVLQLCQQLGVGHPDIAYII
jgi:hypothetical protein